MKNFLSYFKNLKRETILAPLLKMLEAVCELLIPLFVKEIIDNIIPSKDDTKMTIYIIIIFAIAFLSIGIAVLAQYFSAKVATKVSANIKKDIFRHIQELDYEDIDQIGSSTLINKITSDSDLIQNGINMFLRLFLRSPFIVIGALIMSLIVDVKLGLIFVVAIPVLFLIVFFIIYKSISLYKRQQEKLDEEMRLTKDNVTGVRVIRAFNVSSVEYSNFQNKTTDFKDYQFKVSTFTSILAPLTFLIINVSIILIIYFGYNMASLNGTIVAEYNYMSQVLIEIIKLANLSITLAKALAAIKRVNEFLVIKKNDSYALEDNLKLNKTAKEIEFKNVSFSYPNRTKNVLNNLNFSINKGEFIGILGKTASGKSTLINLINNNYQASAGKILIDDNDINNYSFDTIKEKVTITNNNYFFLNKSIKDNLTLGNDIEEDKIMEALKLSNAYDFVMAKGGLDVLVSEGATNFSGGEKERLQIARAILTDADVLIFDASLSALDNITMHKTIDNLLSLKKTLIIASDRVFGLEKCDRIMVLDNNQISGFSSHDTLMKENKLYQDIYNLNKRGDNK